MRGKYKGLVVFPVLLLLASCFLCLRPSVTSAAINSQINFQGKLTNSDGTNVTDGTYSLRFRIYTDPTADGSNACAANSCKWEETQASVSVNAGNFQVPLGSVTALPGSVDFNTAALYLGVKVGSDAEMTPRIQLSAAPYAFNSDKVGGISASGLVQLSPGSQQTGNINVSGNATIGGTYNGNTLSSSALTFSAASVANIQAAASQNLGVDSGTSGALSLGTSNATSITIGKFGSAVNAPGGINVNSGTSVPTADQVVIDNTSSNGVITSGVNGLSLKYKGGAAAVEAAGMRIDYTPGTTSLSTWSGLRVVETVAAGSGVTGYGLKLEGAGAGAGTSYGIEVATGWDIGIDVQSGGMQLAAQAEPTAPGANNLRIYARDIAGKILPKFVGPSGVDTPFQPHLGFNRVAWSSPNNGTNCSTSASTFGTTLTGSANACAHPNLAATNQLTSVRRMTYTTLGTSGSMAYQRQAALQVWRGNATGLGGFFYTIRFGVSASTAANRIFVGLSDTIANPTNVDPLASSTYGKLGMAVNVNTGNWKFINNITGTAPTTVDLGASFPMNSTSALYELVLFSAPNGSSVGYRVTNTSTGAQTSGSVSGANIPSSTTFMAPVFWLTNGTTLSAATLDWAGTYLESDN